MNVLENIIIKAIFPPTLSGEALAPSRLRHFIAPKIIGIGHTSETYIFKNSISFPPNTVNSALALLKHLVINTPACLPPLIFV